ncbi:hypothetical protein PISL3812_08435 [Talaromyces islandicus]|uniref:Uncharacterized protein n=1 Tax=Talaromyces islandicus TaxID=28573 RepID=A0A0U1M755_TALIS|nr:hypothetical protein PISL3812_08435 [Talaromyces islandicus]
MLMTTATTVRHTRQHAPNTTLGLKPFSVSPSSNMTTLEDARSILEAESRQLQRSWKEFQDALRQHNHNHHHDQRPLRPADKDHVCETLADAVHLWTSSNKQQSLFRKPVKWARICLESMDGHPALMQSLPDPKRTSDLFFGVVHSIITASKEQYRVAGVFLKFLARINKAVAAFDRPGEFAAALYAQIFLFLGEFMADYVSKARCRVLSSHNEDFKTNFQNLVSCVEDFVATKTNSVYSNSCPNLEAPCLDKVGLEGAARVRVSQTTLLRQLIWSVQQKKLTNARLAQGWKRTFDLFLAALEHRVHQVDADSALCHLSGNSFITPQSQQTELGELTTKRRFLKLRLQQDSSHLQDFFDNTEQIYPFSSEEQLVIPATVATEIYNWMRTNPSLPLVVEGSRSLGLPGRLTLISACCVSIARQHSIPAISHFCAASSHPSKEAGLLGLVYSLIRQLIDLSPPMLDFDSNCDLSTERFNRLNGTMASWTDAVGILNTLLRYKPPVLFCVIDALDLLEDASTQPHIKSLVDMLVSHTIRSSTAPVDTEPKSTSTDELISKDGLLKVLFTTAGQCRAIQSNFSQGQGQIITTDATQVETTAVAPVDKDVVMEG